MCLKRLRLILVTNSLSECSIIVYPAMKSLWIWIATFWRHLLSSSCYKVGRYAWSYETLCLVVIRWNPTQASIGTLWPNVLPKSTVAKLSCFCVSCGQHPCFWDVYRNVQFISAVTGKVLCGWPLLPCVYNNRITINILYFSPEQVVSRCLLKLQRPLS